MSLQADKLSRSRTFLVIATEWKFIQLKWKPSSPVINLYWLKKNPWWISIPIVCMSSHLSKTDLFFLSRTMKSLCHPRKIFTCCKPSLPGKEEPLIYREESSPFLKESLPSMQVSFFSISTLYIG